MTWQSVGVFDSAHTFRCLWCGTAQDLRPLPSVLLDSDEANYAQSWFHGVQGDVSVLPVFCGHCGNTSGIALGEDEGALRMDLVRRPRQDGDPEMFGPPGPTDV